MTSSATDPMSNGVTESRFEGRSSTQGQGRVARQAGQASTSPAPSDAAINALTCVMLAESGARITV